MSSPNFTTAYDLVVARIATLLPNHTRLRDPYNLDQNPDSFLEQGWGLAIGPGGENSARLVGPKRTTIIQFLLHITRRSYALDMDPVGKATTDKNLLEDLRAIIDDIWLNNFNISGSPLIKFEGFAGVFPVKVDSYSHLALTATVTAEYFVSS